MALSGDSETPARRPRRTSAETKALYERIAELAHQQLPMHEIAARTGESYDRVRVYLYRAAFRVGGYRQLRVRVRHSLYDTLLAAAEVRQTTPADIVARLVEVTLRDRLIDSVLDDRDDAPAG